MPTTGIVSDILNFSVNDGPGIRTVIFLKGCPLKCAWCHNPENGRKAPQVLYRAAQCIGCGACAEVCPREARGDQGGWITDGLKCTGCGRCVSVCPVNANTLYGRVMTPAEAAEKVMRDKPFFRDKGGATFSGGEPLTQADWVRECAAILKENGIGTAIETSCYAGQEDLAGLLQVTDLWLCDWKISDPELHLKMTGADNGRILENLRYLSSHGAKMILRCPVIPGINDNEEHLRTTGLLADRLAGVLRTEILPYHAVGNDKRHKMGLESDGFRVPEAAEKENWGRMLKQYTSKPVLVR